MKIAFLSSSTGWGGLERNLVRYAQWMGEAGHKTEMLCVHSSPLEGAALKHGLQVHNIQRQHRYLVRRAASVLKEHLRLSESHVLWVRDPRDLPMCSVATQGTGVRLLFHQGMQIPRPKKSPWHRRRFAAVDQWVAPLEQLKNQALSLTPLKESQIAVIPLALEDNWFEVGEQSQRQARAQWQLPAQASIVGLFGRLDALKGHATLLRALSLPEASTWHAFFVGEETPNAMGGLRNELESMVCDLNLSDRVHWFPNTDQLESAYDACDAYAMCSVSETIGMVTLEAMARRIPVIGTRSGGTPELLAHGEAGVLFEPENPQQLADLLSRHSEWPLPSTVHLDSFKKSTVMEKWSNLLHGLGHSPS